MSSYSTAQKTFLGIGAAVLGFLNPWRGDMISLLSQVSSTRALVSLRDKMLQTDEGLSILRQRPRLNSSILDPERLDKLPEGSFGKAYASFMSRRGFSADDRQYPQHNLFQDQEELGYVLERYREQHDLWHVLLGLDTHVEGELAQKVFEFMQTGLPMCAVSAVFGPLRLSSGQRRRIRREYLPWAIACHRDSVFLMGVRLEDMLEFPLDQVRSRLRITSFQEYNKSM
jgi:ubiquinone biosynthesis protein COQ4